MIYVQRTVALCTALKVLVNLSVYTYIVCVMPHPVGVRVQREFSVPDYCTVWLILLGCSEASDQMARVQRGGGRGHSLCWWSFLCIGLCICQIWEGGRHPWFFFSPFLLLSTIFSVSALNGDITGVFLVLMGQFRSPAPSGIWWRHWWPVGVCPLRPSLKSIIISLGFPQHLRRGCTTLPEMQPEYAVDMTCIELGILSCSE